MGLLGSCAVMLFLSFAAVACLNARLLEKVFAPYREQKKEEEAQ